MALSACGGYYGKTDDPRLAGDRGTPLVIKNGTGGHIFISKMNFDLLHRKNVTVVIDGTCSSACTWALSERYTNVCWTDKARFRFHGAYQPDTGNPAGMATSPELTRTLWEAYPASIQAQLPPPETWHHNRWFEIGYDGLPGQRRCTREQMAHARKSASLF